ncbi:MAG: hypothetical protein ACXW4L_06920, partial [Candidatus Limnocylindrales bacterium]
AVGLADISVEPTHAVGDGLFGAIIKATKPADWTAASVRPVDLPRPGTDLPVLAVGDGCGCGSGGCC